MGDDRRSCCLTTGHRSGALDVGLEQILVRRRSRISQTAPASKSRMQENDLVTSVMYTRGIITCFNRHAVHGTANNVDLLKPARIMCPVRTVRMDA